MDKVTPHRSMAHGVSGVKTIAVAGSGLQTPEKLTKAEGQHLPIVKIFCVKVT